MTIQNSSILWGGTLTPSGGSSVTLKSLSGSGNRTFIEGTSYLDRKLVDFNVREPVVKSDAPNGYTQKRNTVLLKVPLSLDNGNTTMNTLRIELSSDVETTDAEIDEILSAGAQLLTDSDYADYWHDQSVD